MDSLHVISFLFPFSQLGSSQGTAVIVFKLATSGSRLFSNKSIPISCQQSYVLKMQVIGFSLVSEALHGSFHLTNKVNASYMVLKGPWSSFKSFLQSREHLVQCSKGLRLLFMLWSQPGLPSGREWGIEDRNMSFKGDWIWTGIPALPPTSCVTLG